MKLKSQFLLFSFFITIIGCNKSVGQNNSSSTQTDTQSIDFIKIENVTIESEGIKLVGTIYRPKNLHSAVVIVHGSVQVPRMTKIARQLAQNDI